MAAPTFVSAHDATNWFDSANTNNSTTFTPGSGNILVALGVIADTGTLSIAGGPTWTLQQSNVTASNCQQWGWTGVGAGASATITFTPNQTGAGREKGWGVYEFSGSDGVGASAKATNQTSGGPSLSITTTQANSAIVVIASDWNAVDGATRTWRTVNGFAPSSGNGAEKEYQRNTSAATHYVAVYPDAGAAGAKTVGLSAPASGMKWSIIAIEVKGTASGGGATATPSVVAAPVSIGSATISASSNTVAAPPRVSAVATVPAPTISSASNATVAPARVSAVVSVPTPTVSTGGGGGTYATHTGFAAGDYSGLVFSADGGQVVLSTAFYASGRSDAQGSGVEFYLPSGSGVPTTGFVGYLMDSTTGGNVPDRILESKTLVGSATLDAANRIEFDNPEPLADGGKLYWAAVYFPGGGYGFKTPIFDVPIAFNDLSGLFLASNADAGASTGGSGNASYGYGAPGTFPVNNASSGWFGVNPVVRVPVGGGASVSPAVVAAAASVQAPTVTAASSVFVTPASVAAAATIAAPTVVAVRSATATPSVVSAAAAVAAPTVQTGAKVSPAVVTAAAVISAPAVTTSTGVLITPPVVLAAAGIPSLSGSTSSTVTPPVVSGVTMVYTANVSTQVSRTVSPVVVAASAAVPSLAISAGSGVTAAPATIAAAATVPAPSVTAGGNATASPPAVTAVAVIPGATLHAAATVLVSTVSVTSSIPTPTVSGATSALITPVSVAAAAAVPAVTVTGSVSATATPAMVAAVTVIPAPVVRVPVSVLVSPAAVMTTAGIPTPVVTIGPRAKTTTRLEKQRAYAYLGSQR